MKFKCEVKKLNEAVSNVSLAVSSKSSMISIEGILLKCKRNQLELIGYNLEFGIIRTIDIIAEKQGEIVLNARILSEIIRKVSEDEIEFECENNIIFIKSGNSSFTINGIQSEEFPELPMVENNKEFSIQASLLKNMISQTKFAISNNEQNPIYTGSLFEVNENSLTIVSVDGYRLALRKEKISIDDEFSFIVPGSTLKEIFKLIKDDKEESEDDNVNIKIGNKHVILEIGEYTVISRLLEGQFIDYREIIKVKSSTKIKVNKKDLSQSVERVSIILNDRLKSPVKCVLENNQLHLSCYTNIGNVKDVVNVEKSGNDLTIGFNNKYLTDALNSCDTDVIKIEFGNSDNPIKILPLDESDNFLFLVLPVRLRND